MALETIIIVSLFFGAIGAAIAHMKNRSLGEGFLFGALLSVIGVIIVLFLPSQGTAGAVKPGWYPDPAGTGGEKYWNGKEWSDLPPRPTQGPPPPHPR